MKKKYFTEEEKRIANNERSQKYRKSDKWKKYYKEYDKIYYTTVKKNSGYSKIFLSKLRSKAKSKGYGFNLTSDDLIVPEYCPILGIKLDTNGTNDFKPSIDRVDNTKGYVKGNIIIVSGRVNRIKSDASLKELNDIVNFYNRLSISDNKDDK